MSAKKPWFRRKRHLVDTNAVTWQGWVYIVTGVTIELAFVYGFKHFYPGWFRPKMFGWGTTFNTWQGAVVIFSPVIVFVTGGYLIYRKQKNDASKGE